MQYPATPRVSAVFYRRIPHWTHRISSLSHQRCCRFGASNTKHSDHSIRIPYIKNSSYPQNQLNNIEVIQWILVVWHLWAYCLCCCYDIWLRGQSLNQCGLPNCGFGSNNCQFDMVYCLFDLLEIFKEIRRSYLFPCQVKHPRIFWSAHGPTWNWKLHRMLRSWMHIAFLIVS